METTDMQTYTLPRETFNLLLEVFGNQQKAEIFARTMESAILVIDTQAREGIVEKKEMIKIEVKDELRKELITREVFEEAQKGWGKEMSTTRELFNEGQKRLEKEILITRELFGEGQKRLEKEILITRELFGEGQKRLEKEILITRELFEEALKRLNHVVDERFKVVDEKFKSLEDRMDERLKSMNFKLNLFLAIALIALTFANHTFVALIQKLF